jgi:hypothetical protein
VVALLAAALTMTACSTEEARPSGPPVAFGTPVPVADAPPVPEGESPVGRPLPVVLDQNTAYVGSPGELKIVDTATGQTTDTVRPHLPVAAGTGRAGGPPLLTTGGDGATVVWPFLVQAPPAETAGAPGAGSAPPTGAARPPGSGPDAGDGSSGSTGAGAEASGSAGASGSASASGPPSAGASGSGSDGGSTSGSGDASTNASDGASPPGGAAPAGGAAGSAGTAVELTSVRADNHSAQGVPVALPEWASSPSTNLSVTPLGASGNTVVLAVTNGVSSTTLAADAGSGRTLWSRDNFSAGAVVGDLVVGAEPEGPLSSTVRVAALAVVDGSVRWTRIRGYGLHVSPAGPTLVAVIGQATSGANRNMFELVNASTGAAAGSLAVPPTPSARCVYDDAATAICFAPDSRAEGRAVAAADAQTGQRLWTLPDYNASNETAPLITAAHRGLVYGTRDGRDTVVWQAKDKTMVGSSPGPAPMVVGDHGAIGLDDDHTHIVSRPATS